MSVQVNCSVASGSHNSTKIIMTCAMRKHHQMLCTFLYVFSMATGTFCFHKAPASCASCRQEEVAGSSCVSLTRFFEKCNPPAEPRSKIIRFIANWRIYLSYLLFQFYHVKTTKRNTALCSVRKLKTIITGYYGFKGIQCVSKTIYHVEV
jgi:hypothetical protein